MKLNKKIIILLFLILFILTGCSKESPSLNEKAKDELEYLSLKIINILNRLNNITFENYQVTAENVNLSKESAESEKSSESSSSQSSGNQPAQVKESSNSSSNIIASQLSPNTILNPVSAEIDWPGIKNEIENIYYSWNTVLIDFNQLDINNDDILGFSSDLDKATMYIKNEDKANALLAMANLYDYLPNYAETISNDMAYNNIIKTKAFILNAYSLLETGNWNDILVEIDKANETFRQVTTDATFVSEHSYRVNKTYVLLNELRNSVNRTKDRDVFLIQYRNLMEEINELS